MSDECKAVEKSTMECEICEDILADSFCIECAQRLCSSCYNHHRKVRSTKHHRIVALADVPNSSKYLSSAVLFCPEHNDKKLEYYCTDHDAICCSNCVIASHRQCQKLEYLSEKAVDSRDCLEYKIALSEASSLFGELKKYVTSRKDELQHIENQAQVVADVIKSTRIRVNLVLDQIQEEAELKLKSIADQHKTTVEKQLSSCETLLHPVESLLTELERSANDDTEEVLFVKLKASRTKILKEYQPILLQALLQETRLQLNFTPDKVIQTVIQDLKTFGDFEVVNKTLIESQSAEPGETDSSDAYERVNLMSPNPLQPRIQRQSTQLVQL